MSHLIDAILLLALILTSLRVGGMYRELRKLRGYQSQYIEIFEETGRAVDEIDAAVRSLNEEGREVLGRLGAGIEEARQLATRLEALARPAVRAPVTDRSDDIGTYSRRVAAAGTRTAAREAQSFKNEILNVGKDTRSFDAAGGGRSEKDAATREFRMAPSVATLRAAGGNS